MFPAGAIYSYYGYYIKNNDREHIGWCSLKESVRIHLTNQNLTNLGHENDVLVTGSWSYMLYISMYVYIYRVSHVPREIFKENTQGSRVKTW